MSKLVICFLLLVTCALTPATLLAEKNPATGLQADPAGSSFTPVPQRLNATRVIWDTTHGVCFGYEPSGSYAAMVSLLTQFDFTTTSEGIDNIDTSLYDILVINAGSSCETMYTASEVAAAVAFAEAGGSVLIMGDNSAAWVWNINPVAEAWGLTTGVNTIQPLDLYFSNWLPIPLFTGLDQLYMAAAGRIEVTSPAEPVAWTDDYSDVVIAVVENPCVVALGDINTFAEYIVEADNQAFAIVLFNWLAECGPVPAEKTTWGQFKALYR